MSRPETRRTRSRQPAVWLAWLMVCCGAISRAQIADQVIVVPDDSFTSKAVLRFDRKLNLLGTSYAGPVGFLGIQQGMGVDGTGLYWLTLDALNTTKLLRMTSDGQFLPAVLLGHNPISLTVSLPGTVYALTRIPLVTTGPAYAVSSAGTVLWQNADLASKFIGVYARYPAVTPDGRLWVADASMWPCFCGLFHALLAELDTATGNVLRTAPLPDTSKSTGAIYLAASPDGSLWTNQSGSAQVHINVETGSMTPYFVNGGFNGATSQLRVDANGDVWVAETDDSRTGNIFKVSSQDGSLADVRPMGGFILGFALGAAGEDIFAVVSNTPPPFPRRLVRVNLVTGTRSTRPLDPPFDDSAIPNGDPTGFVYANVIDQEGDNDGDGWANRAETLAGSSPYDAISTPVGPKVYISFAAGSNAIVLTWKDPNGLFDAVGGLDLQSIELYAEGYGEVMNYLWPFLTSVVLAPDGTEATIELGGLPLPLGLKIALEPRVADKTGATAWDWQVTPPGDL